MTSLFSPAVFQVPAVENSCGGGDLPAGSLNTCRSEVPRRYRDTPRSTDVPQSPVGQGALMFIFFFYLLYLFLEVLYLPLAYLKTNFH